MKFKLMVFAAVMTLAAAPGWADELILKNGREHSGKFVRGDANTVEFRIQGRVETFRIQDVAQIVFREPEMVTPPTGRAAAQTEPQAEPPVNATPPVVPPSNAEIRSAPPVRHVPPENGGNSATLPANTPIVVRMTEAVDTDRNRVGDTFTATLEDPLSVGNQVVAPRGTEVTGTIAYARESGRVAGQSELILELTSLKLGGKSYPIRTTDYYEAGASRGRRTAATAGGGAALGAIIGAIAGGGKGAAVGAATGAAVGTGVTVMTKGQTLKVPAETILEFKLQSPVSVPLF